jgi:hypothetical protein
MADLTSDEERWVRSLRRVAAKCPPSLGVWGGTGDLLVIALTPDGAMQHGEGADEHIVIAASVPMVAGGGAPDSVDLSDIDRPWVDNDVPGATR